MTLTKKLLIVLSLCIGLVFLLNRQKLGAVPKQDEISRTATFSYDETNNTWVANTTNASGQSVITTGDSPAIDAFGRFRVSNPVTLFDSKNTADDYGIATTSENLPLYFDNQELSGGGTGTYYDVNSSTQALYVSANTAGVRVRQTKQRFNYQPGKSQLVILTFNLKGTAPGITKREGIFDDNNGLFLQSVSTTVSFVRRTSVTSTVADYAVTQANWNLDTMDGTGPSGITLNWEKTQILYIDYEWLGVGRVRMGFVVDGMVIYAHEFNNANNLETVYMRTPNLPLRSEIRNDGTGAYETIEQICSTVISEGGSQELGTTRATSTAGVHLDADVENTNYALLGIRLKGNYLDSMVKILSTAVQIQSASHKVEYQLIFNPTVAGTFTYNRQNNSSVEIAKGATANTVTGGTVIASGYAESGGLVAGSAVAGSSGVGIDNVLRLGSTIAGVPDTIVLVVKPIGGSTNVDVEGSLTWKEF